MCSTHKRTYFQFLFTVSVACTAPWITYGDSCYTLITTAETRYNADAICKNNDAMLVKIDSAEENDFIEREYLTGSVVYWIGLSDSENEGTWKWIDRTELTGFKNWKSGQPDDFANQDCGTIRHDCFFDAEWDDDWCSLTKGFICEK